MGRKYDVHSLNRPDDSFVLFIFHTVKTRSFTHGILGCLKIYLYAVRLGLKSIKRI